MKVPRAALLGAQRRAVGGEEADLDLAQQLGRWPRRSGCGRARRARVAPRRRPERGAQALERRDRVGREDGGAAAAERPCRRGVGADDRDAAQLRARERQQRALVARQHEAGRRGGAQLGGHLALRPRRAPAARPARRRPAPRRAPRGAAAAGPCRPPPPRSRARRGRPATSASPHGPVGPGMTRSSAALPAASVERPAYQSDMTTPSKPHSSLSTSRSIGLSVIVEPLTPL